MPIELKGVRFGYTPERDVLNGIDLTCSDGLVTGIVGPNGCGKTTMIKVMAGYLKPNSGVVMIDGKDVVAIRQTELARLRAVVEQKIESPFSFPVYDFVMLGRISYQKSFRPTSEDDHRAVVGALQDTDTIRFQDRTVNELSGGELQRVMIAKALAQQPGYLLLDEPTSHLDIRHQLELMELLSRLSGEITIVSILHELNMASAFCDEIVMMKEGRVSGSGSAADVLTMSSIEEVFDVIAVREKLPETGRYNFTFSLGAKKKGLEYCHVHVITGGGRGRHVLTSLKSAGYSVSAGVLNRGDHDHDTALSWEIDLVEAPSFSRINEDEKNEMLEMCANSDAVVLVATDVGQGNLANVEAAASLLGKKPVIFFNQDRDNRKFDYTGGEATRLYDRIITEAIVVSDIDSLFDALEKICNDKK